MHFAHRSSRSIRREAVASTRATTDAALGIEALYATGHHLLESERYEPAKDIFRTMVLVAPDDERAWLGLGLSHERFGETGIARQMYATGTICARPSFRCHVALATLARAEGDDETADLHRDLALELADTVDMDGDELDALLVAAGGDS